MAAPLVPQDDQAYPPENQATGRSTREGDGQNLDFKDITEKSQCHVLSCVEIVVCSSHDVIYRHIIHIY